MPKAIAKKAAISSAISKIEVYIHGLSNSELPYLHESSLQAHIDTILGLKNEYIIVQDDIIAKAADQEVVNLETTSKSNFIQTCDALITLINTMIRQLPAASRKPLHQQSQDAPQLTADFTKIISEMMTNNQAQVQQMISAFQQVVTSNNCNTVKLPYTNLPHFDGKASDWVSFKDRFLSSVVNHSSLSGAQKLEYLNGALSGEAAATIKHLSLTDTNFSVAWSLLKSRYERKNDITSEHVRRFYAMPFVDKNDPESTQTITNIYFETLLSLDALRVRERDPFCIEYTLSRMDTESRVLWGRESAKDATPSAEKFGEFLRQRCIDHKNSIDHTPKPQPASRTPAPKTSSHSHAKRQLSAFHNAPATSSCQCCQESKHPLYKCPKFVAQSPQERFETVRKLHLCRNCLGDHHTSKCTFRTCNKCQGRHNILLHDKFVQNATENGPNASGPQLANTVQPIASGSNQQSHQQAPQLPLQLPASAMHNQGCQVTTKVFLATAIVDILAADGQKVPCRVLLDSGAQISIMTTALAQKLKLPKSSADLAILGVGSQSTRVKHRVTATIFSKISDDYFSLDCHIMPKITGNIPNWPINPEVFPIPAGVTLADPTWAIQAPVDLLVSGDVYWQCILSNSIPLGPNLPHLRETLFGYILVGQHQQPVSEPVHVFVASTVPLEDLLKRFWEIDELPDEAPLTEEHKAAELHFSSTYKRTPEGRFLVQLPFKDDPSLLGDSRRQAVRQLLALERKFQRKPEMKKLYVDVINDYIERGWIETVPSSELRAPSYYMPHHGVVKESSTTTKLRVVYNGSAKTSSGYSLNDILMAGPTIQPDLFSILVRFRLHPYALTADIAKMYLQVVVDPNHTDFQRIVWREDPDQPIVDLRIKQVCFGVKSSAFLSIRSLDQVASDCETEQPLASYALRNTFYVDDCLLSAKTMSEALEIQKQLIDVLSKAGFVLTKWSSNHPELTVSSSQEPSTDLVTIQDSVISTLGMTWDSKTDIFRFSSAIDPEVPVKTKREYASAIARVFDPMGLIGPVVIEAKIKLQELHQLKMDWDAPLSEEVQDQWQTFARRHQDIDKLEIQRWISSIANPTRTELHAFCDASLQAYGAAVYVVTSKDGIFSSNLMTAKSKVAPLTNTSRSVPRLELCGALLVAELVNLIKDHIQPNSIHFWSDSTVVLSWLNSPPEAYRIFVANRIRRILELSNATQWRHVSSQDNPADIISRGTSPSLLYHNQLWWKGPRWLSCSSDYWPPPFKYTGLAPVEVKFCMPAILNNSTDPIRHLYSLISSLTKIIHIVAYCYRLGTKPPTPRGPFQADEIEKALRVLTKLEQEAQWPGIIPMIYNQSIPRKWRYLIPLTPFVDREGIIRVGGRLTQADAPFSARHPMLLPISEFSRRLFRLYHEKNAHAAQTLLIATMRQRYWPLAARDQARKVVQTCIKCLREKPKTLEQLMGDLPEERVKLQYPFYSTGVDFAGPLDMISSATRGVRSRKAGTQKVYIAIFVCMATKAVHLELVTSLSTEAFIQAFRRFTDTRITPRNMYSDRGTNFRGAAREMERLMRDENAQKEIIEDTNQDGIIWHFNPPASPHHGGLWEAGVKSMKYHLKRITHTSPMSYEELDTVLCKIAKVLNSRPLCTISNDPNDLTILTPSHFLSWIPTNSLPDPDLQGLPINRQTYYQQCQARAQEFARRWRIIYLNNLQQRQRWRQDRENLAIGDVVLLFDETNPEGSKWVLGRVEAINPGRDRRVRVATVRTARGTYIRTITKISKLPIIDRPATNSEPTVLTFMNSLVQPGEDVRDGHNLRVALVLNFITK